MQDLLRFSNLDGLFGYVCMPTGAICAMVLWCFVLGVKTARISWFFWSVGARGIDIEARKYCSDWTGAVPSNYHRLHVLVRTYFH